MRPSLLAVAQLLLHISHWPAARQKYALHDHLPSS